MPRIARLAALALLLLAGGSARAQGYLGSGRKLSTMVSLAWEAGVPRAGLRGFVDETSYQGGQFEVRIGVAKQLSLGIAASANWFARSFDQATVELPPANVSGPLYRRALFTTARGTAHWLLLGGRFQPYLGGGIGAAWSSTWVSVLDAVDAHGAVHLAWDPQAGILWSIGPGLAIHAQIRRQYTRARFPDGKRAEWIAAGIGLAIY